MSDSAFPWHFGANKKLVQLSTFSPQPLFLLFPFVQIAECICSNCNMYLFKLLDILVQIAKSVFVHLLSSTSPFPSPFPFPILELKISRFRIFKRTLWIEFVPAIYLANKKKGEEEVGEMFQSNIHIPDLWQNYFVQKVFVFELLCVGKFFVEKVFLSTRFVSTFSYPLLPLCFSYKTMSVVSLKTRRRQSFFWSRIRIHSIKIE